MSKQFIGEWVYTCDRCGDEVRVPAAILDHPFRKGLVDPKTPEGWQVMLKKLLCKECVEEITAFVEGRTA